MKNCYSETEKKIFINYFLKKAEGSRQAYTTYINEFMEEHTEYETVRVKKSIRKNIIGYKTFNTHNKLWDKNHNLVTYMLSHPDFTITNTQLRLLNLTHPNWSYQDFEGNNALHYLARDLKLYNVKKIITDLGVDPHARNKKGEYFTTEFLKKSSFMKYCQPIDNALDFYIKAHTMLNTIHEAVNDYPTHFNNFRLAQKEWELTRNYLLEDNPYMAENIHEKTRGMYHSCEMECQKIDKVMLFSQLNKELVKQPVISRKIKI